jgi:hypothetical protein
MATGTPSITPLDSMFGAQPSPFMAGDEINEYQDALQKSLQALENRYAQPNWFKIAAGFAEPKLGGFFASLGNASNAMGDYVEQQRANELPIAQLRAQLASSKVTMGQRKKAADIFSNSLGIPAEDAQKILSGQMPLPAGAHQLMRPEIVAQLTALDPKIGASAQAMLQAAHEEQNITNAHNQNLIKQYEVDVNNAAQGRKGLNVPPPRLLPIGSGYNDNLPAGAVPEATGTSGGMPALDTSVNADYSLFGPGSAPSKASAVANQSSVIPRVESGNNDKAVSPKGASAAWQVMGATAKDPGFGVTPAKDNSPQELNRVGEDYWNALHQKYGNPTYADIAYNMGPGDTDKWIANGAKWSNLSRETKDYISQTNLLRSAPEAKAAAESGKGATPQATEKPKQPIVLGTRQKNLSSPLYTIDDVTSSLKMSDDDREKNANITLARLENAGGDNAYSETKDATDSLIGTIQSNRKLADSVVAPLAQRGGLTGGLLNGLQSGVGVSLNGLSGNINANVRDIITGSYNKNGKYGNEVNMWQKLNSDAGRVALAQQKIQGVNPNAISNAESALFKGVAPSPSIHSTDLLLYNAHYADINNRMLHEMRNTANDILQNAHPVYKLDPTTRTPTHDVLTSPAMREIAAKYRDEFKRLNDDFAKHALGNK